MDQASSRSDGRDGLSNAARDHGRLPNPVLVGEGRERAVGGAEGVEERFGVVGAELALLVLLDVETPQADERLEIARARVGGDAMNARRLQPLVEGSEPTSGDPNQCDTFGAK